MLILNSILFFQLCSHCQQLGNTWHLLLSGRLLESLHYAAVRCLWTAVASVWRIVQNSRGFICTDTFFFFPPWRNDRLWFAYILASPLPPRRLLLTHQPSASYWLCIGTEGQFGTNQHDCMLLLTCALLYTFRLPPQLPTVVTLVLAEIGQGALSMTQLWFGILCPSWCYAEMNKKT